MLWLTEWAVLLADDFESVTEHEKRIGSQCHDLWLVSA
jgi:hypothetical protein